MKKLLTLLGVGGFIVATSATVVACTTNKSAIDEEEDIAKYNAKRFEESQFDMLLEDNYGKDSRTKPKKMWLTKEEEEELLNSKDQEIKNEELILKAWLGIFHNGTNEVAIKEFKFQKAQKYIKMKVIAVEIPQPQIEEKVSNSAVIHFEFTKDLYSITSKKPSTIKKGKGKINVNIILLENNK